MQNGQTWNCEFLNFNVLLIQLNVISEGKQVPNAK